MTVNHREGYGRKETGPGSEEHYCVRYCIETYLKEQKP
jgi:hypothetical protein